MKISKNFKLNEKAASAPADAKGIRNVLGTPGR